MRNLRRKASYPSDTLDETLWKLIPDDLLKNLVKMVGFRNILAHDYERLDYDIVYDILHERIVDIERFIDEVCKILR